MGNPHTTIIVLNYNGLKITEKFINQLYLNTENFDLIMIDNGSTDGSVDYLSGIAEQKDNFKLICNKDNVGVIRGRNQGWDFFCSDGKAGSDYIIFLDNDQFVEKGWLQQHHEALSKSGADIVGAEAWLMNSMFMPVKHCKHSSAKWTYIGAGGMMMHKSVPEKIGMFDERFGKAFFEDPDVCFRAIDHGYKLYWNYRVKIVHLAHQTLGKNPKKMEIFKKSMLEFQQKWKGRRPASFCSLHMY